MLLNVNARIQGMGVQVDNDSLKIELVALKNKSI